eukprot:CAMPEP_0113469434 /NCGR_PEP_ID=MMETSP0014_2-20120614/15899_1 /TAXON_ID=2857 /ORGANISM="Nitzschia sp." /LENGTH=193 /DNA_ID=CAMNT_0000361915 /DNA_START=203 /DNA_END=784 /DNA_ORIENTATION=+ /assembly_acc=CAM_ASM_000159
MPRLGGGGGHASSSRGAFTAAASLSRFFSPSNRNARNVILGLVVFFLLRNILRNDYRAEEKAYLRQSGMTDEQIERYIPKTATERKKYVEDKKNDFEKMKNDIAFLLSEVAELKASSSSSHSSGADTSRDNIDNGDGGSVDKSHAGRGAALSAMDSFHEEKRRQHEEQLLKEHPNFKPSKRIKRDHGDTATQR